MILSGFNFGQPLPRPGTDRWGRPFNAAPRLRYAAMPPQVQPVPAQAQMAQIRAAFQALQAENAELRRRLQAAAQLVQQLQARQGVPQAAPVAARAPVTPAAAQVVEMAPAAPAVALEAPPLSATDRAFYGEHLNGSHPHDFGGDFGDIDQDLGLEG